jgi:para-nitrobenzyl esterase
MKKLYLLLAAIVTLYSLDGRAQCPSGRYLTEIFPAYTKDSVLYSSVYNQYMDVYQPAGDTMAHRPVIILAHGGSFITGNGDRTNDPTIDSLCQRFAKRGYVTVSIDYRTTDALNMLDSALAIDEVAKAMSDGKAAIRFFVKDAATANTYKIDTNNIFVGGNSAGAVLYMHVAYIDSFGELPSYIAAAVTANGGFEGNSGNPGYTTRSKAVINLAGALNEVSFVGHGDKPSANAQGTADNIVPYNCGRPLAGATPVTLCGLGQLEPAYVANGIYHMSHIFPGDGHVPWSTDNVKLYTVDSMVTIFLYNLVCTNIVQVNNINVSTEVSLFPNPVSDVLNIRCGADMREISLCDQTGRVVFTAPAINRDNYEINTSHLPAGVYFARIRFSNGNNAPVVRKIVVE